MNKLKKILPYFLFFIVFIVAAGFYAASVIRQAANAYVFGYPLVLMDLTRESMATQRESGRGSNHLYHMRSMPDASFRNVVRPNNDTLYSVTWFDLSQQPMIISTPATDRYYVLPFMDAWTNVFASIGTLTTGKQAGNYVLLGPNWSGPLPPGLEIIKAPTNIVWMIGRIQVNSPDDIAVVAAIQDQLQITPLEQWPDGEPYPASIIDPDKLSHDVTPKEQIDQLDTQDFFNRLSFLMDKQPASSADHDAVANLAQFSIFPGQEFDLQALPPLQRKLLQTGMQLANQKLHEATESRETSPRENGWTVWRDSIGSYGTNYPIRAGVAMVGLGALQPSEAVYPTTFTDSNGSFLDGQYRYRIHMPSPPPNHAFWSLTLYDIDGFLVENPLKRYSIGDRDQLQYNPDGSLDIVIQQQPPDNNSNWLPAPTGAFSLTLRIYRPDSEFLSGAWEVPGVERQE